MPLGQQRTMTVEATIGAPAFWKNVDMSGACWPWRGPSNPRGYGRLRFEGRKSYVHRAVYETFFGPIPAGLVVMHVCDNPKCVRPSHLRVGTQIENMRDMAMKGRGRKSNPSSREQSATCRNGHEYAPLNIYRDGKGKRRCRICMKIINDARPRAQSA